MEERCLDERLRGVVFDAARGGVALEEIVHGKRLREDLTFDSVGLVDLIVALESAFGIYFDPLECDLTRIFDTTTTLESFVRSRMEAS